MFTITDLPALEACLESVQERLNATDDPMAKRQVGTVVGLLETRIRELQAKAASSAARIAS